jgi:uncharacterized protein with ParB-like and HNH nuclease domain
MSRYNDISIKKLVKGINEEYVLPDIQRPFVWGNDKNKFEDKVCSLFDSIMKKYPIGTFLFWKINEDNLKKYNLKLLKFINISNEEKNSEFEASEKTYNLVLDGQQRMTIFNLVFKGNFKDTYRKKERNRNLYLNIFKDYKETKNYEFKFFENEKGEYFQEKNELWFSVKTIFNLSLLSEKKGELVNEYSLEKEKELIIEKNLEILKNGVNEENLSYYEIGEDVKDEEALEIFIRVNSKGMVLSYSDLLFSKITQFWKTDNSIENARDLFYIFLKGDDVKGEEKGINRYGEGFDFDNDFILKTALVLIESEIKYNLKNFTEENIKKIKTNWDGIKNSIKIIIEFLVKIGINNKKLLRSKNSIIPLIYYIFSNNSINPIELNSKYREPMEKYIYTILLNGVFGGQTDQLLNDCRTIIKENKDPTFPLNNLINKLKQKRNIKKGEELRDLINEIKYNTDKGKIILSILYGNEMDKEYQEDHLFPQTKTKKLIDKNLVDNIANIQILKNENQKKSDKEFKVYREEIIKTVPEYDILNFIPKIDEELKDYTIEYFEIFLEKRKVLIFEKIKEYFSF